MTPDELLARYYLARILLWRHDLEELDAAVIADIMALLKTANAELRAEIEKAMPEIWEAYEAVEKAGAVASAQSGAARANAVILATTTPVAVNIANKITQAWTFAAQKSLEQYNDIISVGGLAKAVQQVPVTAESVKALANTADHGGKLLSQWVYKTFDDGVIASITDSLNKSIAAGHGVSKARDILMQRAIDEGFVLTQRNCLTITRSYIQQAHVNAQLAVYENNKELFKGVKWCAVLDSRTCALCAPNDGKIYLWGQPRPPMRRHENCRCVWQGVTKSWRELGLDIDDLEEAARPWTVREDGPVGAGGKKILYAGTSKENFSGWWQTLPFEEQVKSIGVVRTRLINAGKLSWDDLVDRGTGRYYTLQELGFSLSGEPLVKKNFPQITYGMSVKDREAIISEWMKTPHDPLRIATMPPSQVEDFRAKTSTLLFSKPSFEKQKSHHPEIEAVHYAKVQDAVVKGRAFRQDDRNIAYALDSPDGIAAIVKVTESRDELYLTSMRLLSANEKERARAIRKLEKRAKK